jgi:hypothetical protein
VHNPELQFHEFSVEAPQLALVIVSAELVAGFGAACLGFDISDPIPVIV